MLSPSASLRINSAKHLYHDVRDPSVASAPSHRPDVLREGDMPGET